VEYDPATCRSGIAVQFVIHTGKGHPEINDIPKNVEDFKKLGSNFSDSLIET
jgi:hypothetical protein